MEITNEPSKATTKKERRTRACVSFAPSVKKHDGLSSVSILLQDIVLHHLRSCAFSSPRGLLTYLSNDGRYRLLPALLMRMHNLLHRLDRSHSDQRVPLLSHGGGHNFFIPRSEGINILQLYKICCKTDKCLRKYLHRRRMQRPDDGIALKPERQALARSQPLSCSSLKRTQELHSPLSIMCVQA